MKANDSLECRNCHSAQSMDITRQSPRAVDAHQRFLFTGQKTCIDCHKGIAHHLAGHAQRSGLAVAGKPCHLRLSLGQGPTIRRCSLTV